MTTRRDPAITARHLGPRAVGGRHPSGASIILIGWNLLLATSVAGELHFYWSPAMLNEGQCSQVRQWAQNFQDKKNQVYGLCVETSDQPPRASTAPPPAEPK